MAQVDVPLWRWTRAEYERLVECGFFQPDDRVELIGGQLVVAEPQNSPHVCAVGLTDDVLRGAFGRGWVVRVQAPVALDDESEPEPDVAVVPGARRDYLEGHPQRPVLAVEVAESSLASDRTIKGSLYARAGISDYWIINLVDRVVEVYRDPSTGGTTGCSRPGPRRVLGRRDPLRASRDEHVDLERDQLGRERRQPVHTPAGEPLLQANVLALE